MGLDEEEGESEPDMVTLGLPEGLCVELMVPLTVTLPDNVPQEEAECVTLLLGEMVTDCVVQPELVIDGVMVPLTLVLPDTLAELDMVPLTV